MFQFRLMLQSQLVMAGGETTRSVVFKQYSEEMTVPTINRIRGYGGNRKTTGIVLTSVGLGTMAVGAILMGTSTWRTTRTATSVNTTSSEPKALVGMLLLPVGLALTIPGAIIWGIESRR